MAVDKAYLARRQMLEDPSNGFGEEFLTLVLGGARTVAVLIRPLGSELYRLADLPLAVALADAPCRQRQ